MPQVNDIARLSARDEVAGGVLVKDRPDASSLSLLEKRLEVLKDQLHICVVFGGSKADPNKVVYKTPNVRHWKSYQQVAEDIAQALQNLGFRHVTTLSDGMDLPARLREKGTHLVWINSGGVQGMNPMAHTPALLEMIGQPYLWHNSFNAALLDNKHSFKQALIGAGIPTAPFLIWDVPRQGVFKPQEEPRFAELFQDCEDGFIVKPVNGRASQYVTHVEKVEDLERAVAECHAQSSCTVMIEAYLAGREFCIAICGPIVSRDGKLFLNEGPFAFSPVERMLDADEKVCTSMDKRPITTDRIRLLDPVKEAAEVAQLNELAQRVYDAFHLETLVRLDIRADKQGRMFILEANPKPDQARPSGNKLSIICAGLPSLGMSYEDLVLSQLADRMEFLFSHRADSIQHIIDLLPSELRPA